MGCPTNHQRLAGRSEIGLPVIRLRQAEFDAGARPLTVIFVADRRFPVGRIQGDGLAVIVFRPLEVTHDRVGDAAIPVCDRLER